MDDTEVAMEQYKLAAHLVCYENDLLWARNQWFLLLNMGSLAALTAFGGDARQPTPLVVVVAIACAAVCVLWAGMSARGREYIMTHFGQVVALERQLPVRPIYGELQTRFYQRQPLPELGLHPPTGLARWSANRLVLALPFVFLWVWGALLVWAACAAVRGA
jgi:hypothetical protein